MGEQAPTQQQLAEKAKAMADAAEPAPRPDNSHTADQGMSNTPREGYPPSGAFDAEGHEPALRRSRER